jgi:hypothetical protein
MGAFSVKRVAGDGSSFRSLVILLKNASYYFVLSQIIADAKTVL